MPFGRGQRLWKIIASVSVLGLAANSYLTFNYNQNQQEQRDDQRVAAVQQAYERDVQIRSSQVQNCLTTGEPIRHSEIQAAKQDVRDIKTQRQQTKDINLHEAFPNFDRKQLKRLVRQGKDRDADTIAAAHDTINALQNLPPCEQRYPPVPLPITP